MSQRKGVTPSIAMASLVVALITAGATVLAQEDPGGPTDGSRVVVKFEQGNFELVSVTPLKTVLPPSDELPEATTRSGFWFELISAGEELRYRRVIDDPVRLVFEGPDIIEPTAAQAVKESRRVGRQRLRTSARDDAGLDAGTVRRVRPGAEARRMPARRPLAGELPAPDRKEGIPETRVFSVLVPAVREGDVLVIFGSPLELGSQGQASEELARLSLEAEPGGES